MMLEQAALAFLSDKRASSLFRDCKSFEKVDAKSLRFEGKDYLNFSSNDYLGLASDFSLQDLVDIESSLQQPILSGGTASPLVVGEQNIHQQLKLALMAHVFKDCQIHQANYKCLLFSSGFAANQAFISAMCTTADHQKHKMLLVQDKLNHASLIDAGTKAQAQKLTKQVRFRHNDIEQLTKQLSQHNEYQLKLVATESVFSMDGDCAPLEEIADVLTQHNGLLYVDDAHGFGVINTPDVSKMAGYLITFGKALGSQGAALILKQPLADLMINISREFIYSTSISPLQAAATLVNLKKLQSQADRRITLQNNIALFRDLAAKNNLPLMDSTSPIQPILIGEESRAVHMAEELKQQGIWLSAMRTPTVPKGQSRLRVTINTKHDEQSILFLINELGRAVSNRVDSGVQHT
ncbi:8-amino-7-oxononanoate synthase [Psychrosphaera ytuae]|uniref:8-amino-7-oxononanoate synthase n=1 Tax=Psychrosphaera ytuae TaxID=2820710 RepID=A0A975DBY3_9GAMM|nr:8-amino-7-oxononanoate synthase [Psychrosphaera ytuae]QTH64342.1 8-amino-7-oxononanoate synthase [Psychrosphaera ytuae]